MPRPVTTPVRRAPGRGDGRASQPAVFAAAARTFLSRGSRRCRCRYSIGSALTEAAISSMKHSCANVFCSRAGERSGPVKNGESTVRLSTRSLLTTPQPPHSGPTQPVTYEGAVLDPFSKPPCGGGAGVRGVTACGGKPARNPVTTLPGALAPGRPPREGDQPS